MAFSTTLPPAELTAYVGRLIANVVPDGIDDSPALASVETALARLERCFAGIKRKYYTVEGSARFDHLNGDHLATFLYLLSNTVWTESGNVQTAAKLFAANKALHGLDLFYSVRMPEIFMLAHPVGTVLGNAEYQDELLVTQGCTVGSEHGIYPRFGKGIELLANSTVIGDTEVGDDVVFGANAFVLNARIPSHSIVVGQHPNHRILPNPKPVHERLFDPR
jgi:serine O-acetyltransferase